MASRMAHFPISSNPRRPTTWRGLRSHQDITSRRTTQRLLVVEDNDIERQSIVDLLSHDDIEVAAAATGEEAYSLLRDAPSIVASSIFGCRI